MTRIGIDHRVGVGAEAALVEDGALRGLRLTDGEVVPAELLVLATGTMANAELALASGLRADRGILVTDDLACLDDRRVFAIGDCAQPPEGGSGLVAQGWEQSRRLAAALCATAGPGGHLAGEQRRPAGVARPGGTAAGAEPGRPSRGCALAGDRGGQRRGPPEVAGHRRRHHGGLRPATARPPEPAAAPAERPGGGTARRDRRVRRGPRGGDLRRRGACRRGPGGGVHPTHPSAGRPGLPAPARPGRPRPGDRLLARGPAERRHRVPVQRRLQGRHRRPLAARLHRGRRHRRRHPRDDGMRRLHGGRLRPPRVARPDLPAPDISPPPETERENRFTSGKHAMHGTETRAL